MNQYREKKLIKNTLIYAIGNFSSKFIAFFMVVIYTRYLTQKQLGEYDLIITTVSVLLPIISLQINDAMYRYTLDEKDFNQKIKIVNNTIVITIKTLVVFSLLYFLVNMFLNIHHYLIIYVYTITILISNLNMYIARAYQKNKVYSIAGIIRAFSLLLSIIIFVLVSDLNIFKLLISNIIGSITVIIYINYKINIATNFAVKSYNKFITNKMIRYSVPLIPTGISWWIMNLSDRYALNYFIGMDANGIYAVANKFPSLLMLINQLFYLAWQETSITEYTSDDRDEFYSKMFNHYMVLQLSTAMILISITKLLFSFMIGSSFQNAAYFVPLLYFGSVFSAFSSFYGTGYQSSKNTKGALTTSILASLLNIIINIILIPLIGIQAASLSTFMSYFVMWILRLFGTKNYFKITINKSDLITLFTLNTIVVILFYADSLMLDILMVLIASISFLIFNKKFIYLILKKITKTIKVRIRK